MQGWPSVATPVSNFISESTVVIKVHDQMPVHDSLPYPRRYNSLRLLGFDYSSTQALWFVTIKTHEASPLLGDLRLAKSVASTLFNERTLSRLRLLSYTVLPDHLHLLTGVRGEDLSMAIGALKSITTQLYWKRAREIVESGAVSLPPSQVDKSGSPESRALLRSLMVWKVALRPECLVIKNWPPLKPQLYLSKQLWQERFHDHIIRNDADLRETIEYIALNAVKRGYVTKPQFYRFTGWPADEIDVSATSPGNREGKSANLTG